MKHYKKAKNPAELSVFTGLGETRQDEVILEKDVPCQAACPAKTNVPGYIEQIIQGDHDAAYRINQEDNVFPGVLGRICTRPCEDACRHNWTGVQGPVQICHLKRAGADNKTGKAAPLPAWFGKSGKKIAVIGGGPAGLTAARELARFGHDVKIFEKEDHLGGMMVDGIPRFRLPLDVIEQEINLITESGIEVELNSKVDSKGMKTMIDSYDAVLVATGTVSPRSLRLEHSDNANVYDGLEFMKRYNNGDITELSGDVVVIGGGFTAVDCARSCARAARRLTGDENNVSIVYRRTEKYMAADHNELEDIRLENINIRSLASPVSLNVGSGKIESVTFQRNSVKQKAPGEKPEITPLEGNEFTLDCSHIIIAIGQEVDNSIMPESVKREKDAFGTNSENVFVTGDFRTGSLDVIHAVADGKAAAAEIDNFLTGITRKKHHVAIELVENDGETGRFREHDLQLPPSMPLSTLLQRAQGNAEVETGLNENEIPAAATRCYLCNYKFEIDQDKCIHCDWCIDVAPRDCISKVSRIMPQKEKPQEFVETDISAEATFIYINSDNCIRCGKCLRVCPTEAISMRRMDRTPCMSHDGEQYLPQSVEVQIGKKPGPQSNSAD